MPEPLTVIGASALIAATGKLLQGLGLPELLKHRLDVAAAKERNLEEYKRRIEDVTSGYERAVAVAAYRVVDEELNVLAIVQRALEQMESKTVREVDPDLASCMVAKFKTASIEEMQVLWASILAEEAAKPSTFSKRDVDEIAKLSKQEIEAFNSLLGHIWHRSASNGLVPTLVLNEKETSPLRHLDNVLRRTGLLEHYVYGSGIPDVKQGDVVNVRYYGRKCTLKVLKLRYQTMNISEDNTFVLSPLGQSICSILKGRQIPGEFEKRVKEWHAGDLFEVVFAEGMMGANVNDEAKED